MKRSQFTVAAVVLLFSLVAFAGPSDHHMMKPNPNAGFLGVMAAPVDDDAAERLKLESHAGVLVKELIPDSPAEKGGLKVDDVILKADGNDIADVQGFMSTMSNTKPEQSVKFSVMRDGKMTDVSITLGKRPADMNRDDDDKDKDKGDKDKDGDQKDGK